MWRVSFMPPGIRDVLEDQSGLSLIVVSLSLVVLLGMVAFAVDIGALYQEKRELQNGADAAAIAIAEDCALEARPCSHGQAMTTAESFADSNAGDSAAAIDSVVLDPMMRTVDVAVSTETAAGGTIFRPFFAKSVGFNGTTVHATAGAAWGFLESKATLPLIISYCEYARESGYGYAWGEPVAIPPAPVGSSEVGKMHDLNEPNSNHGLGPWRSQPPALLKFHSGVNRADDCAAVAGQDTDGDGRLHGGFGWILDDDGSWDCSVQVTVGAAAPADPGSSPTTGCSAQQLKDEILHKEIHLPVFDDSNDLGGATGEYNVYNFVGFYVTGYNFGGQFKEPHGSVPCGGSTRCLEGYFKFSTTDDGAIGGTDGVIVIKFTD